MPSQKSSRESPAIPPNQELLGPSLAHIIKTDSTRESLLGQAWLAAANTLVTCGHVVDQFVDAPQSLVVKFPFSGNRYQVEKISLHPSFVRQPDQLVRFDLATITVNLQAGEANAKPLPYSFEQQLKPNQSLATLRYPVHLGQLTAAPQPLAQEGHYLGHLRQHDNFHWLHDLPLSPGDSGAPLFAQGEVVAIHCGDTASLPGLNLPTTSIRLGLWIDALREFGLQPTSASAKTASGAQGWLSRSIIFLLMLLVATAVTIFARLPEISARWTVQSTQLKPVEIFFNKPVKNFKYGDDLQISLLPKSDCYLYLLDVDPTNKVKLLYPPYGLSAFVKAGNTRTIDRFGQNTLGVDRQKDKFHLVALISDWPFVRGSDWSHLDPAGQPLTIDGNELTQRIKHLQAVEPQKVLHLIMDAPTAP